MADSMGWETCLPVKTPGQCWLSSSMLPPGRGRHPPGEDAAPGGCDVEVTLEARWTDRGCENQGGSSVSTPGPRTRGRGRLRPLGHRPPTRGRGRLLVPWGMDARVWQRTHCAELPGPGCPKPRPRVRPPSNLGYSCCCCSEAPRAWEGQG